jgi:hypothetical protein
MITDEKYAVDMTKFMSELRRNLPRYAARKRI